VMMGGMAKRSAAMSTRRSVQLVERPLVYLPGVAQVQRTWDTRLQP